MVEKYSVISDKGVRYLISQPPILSKSCNYTLRALLYLATREAEAGGYIGIRQIALELEISFSFLAKIFQKLAQADIVLSYRGPGGGVALARPANTITPLDIVRIIDGEALFTGCLLGLPDCGDAQPCPMHQYWSGLRDKLHHMLESVNLAELAQQIRSEGLRLTP